MTSASPPPPSSSGSAPGPVIKLVVVVAALLVVAGGVAFYLASKAAQRNGQGKTAADVVTVTITQRTCEPNEIVVPAGRTTFRIVNNSDRPWSGRFSTASWWSRSVRTLLRASARR